MGCIETRRTEPEEADSDFRLTLTWDVLKLVYGHLMPYLSSGLTLTWDVLKHLTR